MKDCGCGEKATSGCGKGCQDTDPGEIQALADGTPEELAEDDPMQRTAAPHMRHRARRRSRGLRTPETDNRPQGPAVQLLDVSDDVDSSVKQSDRWEEDWHGQETFLEK